MREPKLAAYAYANTGALVAKTVAIALIAIFAAFSRDGAVEALGLKMPQYAGWTRYICLFLILPLVTRMAYAGNPLLPDLPIRFVYPEAMVIGNIMITFLIVLFAPIVEELIFRGYIYGVFRARLGAGYSVILTSVLFVMAHLPQVGLNAAGISTMSLTAVALGVARYRSGSVIPSVIFHGVYNLTYALSGTAFYLLMGR
jgi:membrane protease YdiL (CAAX protease family)